MIHVCDPDVDIANVYGKYCIQLVWEVITTELSKLPYNYYDHGFSPSDDVKILANRLAAAASFSGLFHGVAYSDLVLDFTLYITQLLYKYKGAEGEYRNN